MAANVRLEKAGLRRRVLTSTVLLMVAGYLLGLAELLILPPWEGFDETAHWSYLQELADTKRPPVYGVDRLAEDVRDYPGPQPYGQAQNRVTYRLFRMRSKPQLAGHPTRYVPGEDLNWEAQHPPLYYLLFAPLFEATRALPWVSQFLALRLASWSLGWLGWCGALAAILRRSNFAANSEEDRHPFGPWTAPIAALWPFLFGSFVADQARIGNDSLCLFLFSAVFALILGMAGSSKAFPLRALAVGALLAAGLWTKAFFLPITAGALGILITKAVKEGRLAPWIDAAVVAAIAAPAAAAWHLARLAQTGSFIGSDEASRLARQSGLLAGLAQRFSLSEFLRGIAGILQTLPWSSTWSLARPPSLLIYGAVIFALLALGRYLARLPRLPLAGWTPLAFIAPMTAGLLWHVLVTIALNGSGLGTPAWYLNVIAPALGLVLALGWPGVRVGAALSAYSLAYTALAQVGEISMFSGCAAPDGSGHFSLANSPCLFDARVLAVLGHPVAAAAAAGMCAACAAGALLQMIPKREEGTPEADLSPLAPL